MKPTVKTDVLKNARGLSLGPPVSVTRDDDDPKQTRRLSPKELNELVGRSPEPRMTVRVVVLYFGVFAAFAVGMFLGQAPSRAPTLPPPVRYVPQTTHLTTSETALTPPTARRLLLPRSARPKKPPGITEPLFKEIR